MKRSIRNTSDHVNVDLQQGSSGREGNATPVAVSIVVEDTLLCFRGCHEAAPGAQRRASSCSLPNRRKKQLMVQSKPLFQATAGRGSVSAPSCDRHRTPSPEVGTSSAPLARTSAAAALQQHTLQSVDAEESESSGRFPHKGLKVLSLMVRRVPRTYTQQQLMDEVDNAGFDESYDFFYLPWDQKNKRNRGFAFINFYSVMDADRFYVRYNSSRLDSGKARDALEVVAANTQGFEAAYEHFRVQNKPCELDDQSPWHKGKCLATSAC